MTIAWSVKPACVIRHLLKDKNDLVSQPQIKSLPKMIFWGGLQLTLYQKNVQLEFGKMVDIADSAKKTVVETIQEFCLAFFRFPESSSNDLPSA